MSKSQNDTEKAAAAKAVGELPALVGRARKGDESAVPRLRELMRTVPAIADCLGGNLAEQAEISLIKAAAGQDLAFREGLTKRLELLRAELAGPDPTPLERLLVERVVACWLQVQNADIRCAQAKDLHLKWAEFYERRMSYAHKRYLSAIKALALVRKLAVPVVQVNIAKKQINVAGVAPASSDGSDPD